MSTADSKGVIRPRPLTAHELTRVLTDPLARRTLGDVGSAMLEAGYGTARAARLFGVRDPAELLVNMGLVAFLQPADLAGVDPSCCHTLLALFWLNGAVSEEIYAATIDRRLRADLDQLGLIHDAGDGHLRGRVTLVEIDGLLLLSDQLFGHADEGLLTWAEHGDVVMPPHESTLRLLRSIPSSDDVRSLLDVGCGSGALTLLLGPPDGEAIGIDLSDRAVLFSRANAVLNRTRAAVRFARADAFEFVAPAPVDRVVFNAPWAPGTATAGDELRLEDGAGEVCRFIDHHLPSQLRPGGDAAIFTLLFRYATGRWDHAVHALQEDRRWRVDITTFPDSPFHCLVEHLDGGRRSGNRFLAQTSADATALAESLRARGVHEIVPVVIALGRVGA